MSERVWPLCPLCGKRHIGAAQEQRPDPEELPTTDNGHPVVARCVHCGQSLTLWKDYRGNPRLAHVANLDSKCPIFYYASADRPVS